MTNQQIIDIVALEAFARYLELGGTVQENELLSPVENNGMVMTLIVRQKKPSILSPDEVERIKAFLSQPPPVATKQPARFTTKEVHDAILSVATHQPVTIKTLARLTGYSHCSHFRESVKQLIDAGLLVRVSNGVKLPEK